MEIIVMSEEEVWPESQPKSAAIALHTAPDMTTSEHYQERGDNFTLRNSN